MTDLTPERHNDTERNKALNLAVTELDAIINSHDPEIDVPINDGVWNALDQLCHSLETAAEQRGYARGIEAAVEKMRKLSGKLDILACEDVLQIADDLSAISPTPQAPVTEDE